MRVLRLDETFEHMSGQKYGVMILQNISTTRGMFAHKHVAFKMLERITMLKSSYKLNSCVYFFFFTFRKHFRQK